jgi:hypothetical protein
MSKGSSLFDRIAAWLRLVEPIVLELCQTIATAWTSVRLVCPPSNFDASPGGFRFLARMEMTEATLAGLTGLCSLLSAVGFLLSALPRGSDAGALLRCVSLSIAGFFWMTLGASFLAGSPDSIAAAPPMVLGCLAWWTLLRSPVPIAEYRT